LNGYASIGAGASQALACLFIGADANTAVNAACHVNMACGGDIVVEKLEGF
jgi:hypothetical protein